jgi:adenosylcobinamide-GDP ribazoletransferase
MKMDRHYSGAILAFQFLTRLPMPRTEHFSSTDLSRSSLYFPLVGLVLGVMLAVILMLGAGLDPWAGAVLALLFWVWVTGGLHLDGLGDLVDALGAAHGDPTRFHAVLKDPHVGSFAAIALAMQLMTKLVFLMLLTREGGGWLLVPLLAWARFGPLLWSATLPVLRPPGAEGAGMGERFGWEIDKLAIIVMAILLVLPVIVAPVLLAAPLACGAWWLFLKYRLGGQTGDCLGAGVEMVESSALAVMVLLILMGV